MKILKMLGTIWELVYAKPLKLHVVWLTKPALCSETI